MRYLLSHICCFLGLVFGFAQSPATVVIDQANHFDQASYQFDSRYEYLVIASGFAKEELRQIPFTDRRILKIDLVYTKFSESAEFDQRQLNTARLERLIALNPQIVVNKFFDWNIIGQTGCNSSQSCLEFFHGFVIYYEEYFTKETASVEIDSIKSELSALDKFIIRNQEKLKITYDRIDCEYPESYYSREYLTDRLEKLYKCQEDYKGRVLFEATMDYKGRPTEVRVKGNLFPCKAELARRLQYVLQWNRGIVIGRKQFEVTAKGYVSFPLRGESVQITSFEIPEKLIEKYQMLQQYSQCVAYHTDTSYQKLIPKITQNAVSKSLARNQWNPELFVVDVTGSMYPFTADLLKWIKLQNDSIAKDYVFFNDGNDKPTNQKVIGKTGGIYHVKTSDFNDVKLKMFEAMRNGGGGDLPENNFEALTTANREVKPTGDIVMVADNYSYPRDEVMMAGFSGKLKIILCHTDKGVNTNYLNLARKYGFTLHTLKSDITDLNQSRIEIEGITYQLERDGFYRIQ